MKEYKDLIKEQKQKYAFPIILGIIIFFIVIGSLIKTNPSNSDVGSSNKQVSINKEEIPTIEPTILTGKFDKTLIEISVNVQTQQYSISKVLSGSKTILTQSMYSIEKGSMINKTQPIVFKTSKGYFKVIPPFLFVDTKGQFKTYLNIKDNGQASEEIKQYSSLEALKKEYIGNNTGKAKQYLEDIFESITIIDLE